MNAAKTEELQLIMEDLRYLSEKTEVSQEDLDNVVANLKSEEFKTYFLDLRNGSKPETALRESFIAGKSILLKFLFGQIIPEVRSNGFIDYLIKDDMGRGLVLELKSFFEAKVELDKARKPILKKIKQNKLNPDEHKQQILKYIQEGDAQFVILTNLMDWCFYSKHSTTIAVKPFACIDFFTLVDEYSVRGNLRDYLESREVESFRYDLDKRFLESLKLWVKKLNEIKFNVDDRQKIRLIIGLINKFIFVQTLDDCGVIEFNWIKKSWTYTNQKWQWKGKSLVLEKFFGELDEWFYRFYDTELFKEDVTANLDKSEGNIKKLFLSLQAILGLTYLETPFGAIEGIMQYNFKHINEDILGKAYETFLVEIRRETGVYYTPAYVSTYIVKQAVQKDIDELVHGIIEAVKTEDYCKAHETAVQLVEYKVLDPACGSGSFLIKTIKFLWSRYNILREAINSQLQALTKEHQGKLLPALIEKKYQTVQELKDFISLSNDRELLSKLILRHIHGNDMDKRAIEVAKVNIWLEAIKLAPGAFNYRTLGAEEEHILPDLEANLISGNSLVGLPIKTTIKKLEAFTPSLKELSRLRNEYLKNPINPLLVDQIEAVKQPIRNELFAELLKHANEEEKKLLSMATPTFWALEYWYAYYDANSNSLPPAISGFNSIIGNPPYYVEAREHGHDFQVICASPLMRGYYEAKMDVFYFFIELGLDLLQMKGSLGFIIMEYWYSRSHAKILRNKLANETVFSNIVHFNEFKVFEEAQGQHNDTLIVRKVDCLPGDGYDVDVIEVLEQSATLQEIADGLLASKFSNKIAQEQMTVRYEEKRSAFHIRRRQIDNLVTFIETDKNFSFNLDNITNGLQTYVDWVSKSMIASLPKGKAETLGIEDGQGVFVLSEKEIAGMALNHAEKALIKPYFEAQQIEPYHINQTKKKWLIYTTKNYIDFDERDVNERLKQYVIDNKIDPKKEDPRVIDATRENIRAEIEEIIKEKYPTITRHLDKFQDVITSDRKPYGIHRSREVRFFESKEKLISVRKTFVPKFAYVKEPCYMAESVNIILLQEKPDSHYILAILNSTLMWFWFKFGAEKTHGEQLQVDMDVLENAPIKIISEPEVKEIASISKKLMLLKRAEEMFYDLWLNWSKKLSNGDISLEKILMDDQYKMQTNDGVTWTKEATFYPTVLSDERRKELDEVHHAIDIITLDQEIVIYGIKEGRKEIFRIKFENPPLFEHTALSIKKLLDSQTRVVSLRDLLEKTKVFVIKPNVISNSGKIIDVVQKEFAAFSTKENITDLPSTLTGIWEEVKKTKSLIDSKVFKSYGLDHQQIKTIMDLLKLPSEYQQDVLFLYDG